MTKFKALDKYHQIASKSMCSTFEAYFHKYYLIWWHDKLQLGKTDIAMPIC